MAVTLVSLTNFQKGIEAAETGINVTRFNASYEPEFKEFVKDYKGEVRGFAIAATMARYRVEGHVAGSTGVMATVFGTAQTFANDVDGFGITAGGIYADNTEIDQTNEGWRTLSATYTRHAAVT